MDLTQYTDDIGPGLLIVAGLILFLIPEPATSTLGIGLMLFGLAYWFYEWGRP